MSRILFSAAAVLALSFAAPTLAQVQLTEHIADQLELMGIDETLIVSQEQVLEIENVLNSTESEETKKTQINEILEQ